jgi:Zn-dependent peptidase ImmA (M78 family)
VSVKPEVLVWARKTIGRDIEEVAKRLNVSEDLVRGWESGEKDPRLAQIKILATYYKRPLAAFFLPEPPQEPPLPKDFRTLPSEDALPLSDKTRLALRRARRLQSLAIQLGEERPRDITEGIGRARLSDDPEDLAVGVRERFRITLRTRTTWKKASDAFNQWKARVEDQGAMVLQMPWPLEEARAFSIVDGETPVIVLNTKDSVRARIFSLFHEFCHLLLHEGGLCNPVRASWGSAPVSDDSGSIQSTEVFCNRFAGAVLIPRDDLLEHDLVRQERRLSEWSEKTLSKLANEFKASREVVLRRLLVFGRATQRYYQLKHDEWRDKAREAQARRAGGRSNPPRQCIQRNGEPFTSLVVESYRNDRITSSDVADYLKIRLKHLPNVERLLEAGA